MDSLSEVPGTRAARGARERAEALADAACHLHDVVVGPADWSREAAEDAVEAIETTAEALATVHPDAAVLAPVS